MNIRQVEIDLDNAWWGHGDIKYEDKLKTIKGMWFKVYRNSEGKHKVIQGTNNMGGFGDIFNDIFGGRWWLY